jgi:hypothetical protein
MTPRRRDKLHRTKLCKAATTTPSDRCSRNWLHPLRRQILFPVIDAGPSLGSEVLDALQEQIEQEGDYQERRKETWYASYRNPRKKQLCRWMSTPCCTRSSPRIGNKQLLQQVNVDFRNDSRVNNVTAMLVGQLQDDCAVKREN